MMTSTSAGLTFSLPLLPEYRAILTDEAIEFLYELHTRFNERRLELLLERVKRQRRIDEGQLPGFLPETVHVRESEWKVAALPVDLQDRRVEITGPVERKMIINALNSGANVFMADFEDSNAATWDNVMQGQVNLFDAVRKNIAYLSPEGKKYALNDKTAVLFVRPRGWHLNEKHCLVQNLQMSGSLFDFGLFFFHNAQELLQRGTGPYFYLPKLESHLEARLWNDIFVFAQDYMGIPQGTIKATVLIETILATFEMDEILYELRQHSAGLNCGRWDYIFSYIKKLHRHPEFLLPERGQVTMTVPFMKAYSELVIRTCHRRGVHAMGGMAAQIPIKNDPEANLAALTKVRIDKEREAKAGHDGTWVAHPGLVALAKEQFDLYMPTPNQIHVSRSEVKASPMQLLTAPEGTITEQGLRNNIDVSIRYIEAWLRGNGCVPLYNLMEDAATAEISRAQVWQWLHHPAARLEDGRKITRVLYQEVLAEQIAAMREQVGEDTFEKGRYAEAIRLFDHLVTSDHFIDFLTLEAYQQID